MKNQSKFGSVGVFFSSLGPLFGGLLAYTSALLDGGNIFLAENWAPVLAALLVLMFGLGWWMAYLIEYLLSLKGQKTAIYVLSAFLLVYILVALSPLVLPSIVPLNTFLKRAIAAGSLISLSGFGLRLSVAQSRITVEPRSHD